MLGFSVNLLTLLALVLEDGLRAVREEAARSVGDDASPLERLAAFGRAHVRLAVERPSGQLIISNVDLLAAHDRTAELLHEHEEAASNQAYEAALPHETEEAEEPDESEIQSALDFF